MARNRLSRQFQTPVIFLPIVNYLAHLVLAEPTPESQLGNFLGDFVKGPLTDYQHCFNADVLKGIATHRCIDYFTDRHPLYLQSRHLLGARYFRFSGIIVDIAYDHFLSKHWATFVDTDFDEFINQFYQNLQINRETLPSRARAIVPKAVTENWLASYQTLTGVNRTLARISHRLKYENPLVAATEELANHYEALEAGFLQFFPDAIAYAETMHQSASLSTILN